jgi:mono/diheme cytochrome c family protein
MIERRTQLFAVMAVLMTLGLGTLAHQSQAGAKQAKNGEGWSLPANAKEAKNPTPATAESIAKGQNLYKKSCELCHGEKGDGSGQMASILTKKPSNLTDKKAMAKFTDGELFWMITKGKLPMPTFEKTITATDRWHIVNFVRSLAK